MPELDVLVVAGVGVDTIVHVVDLEIPSGDAIGVPPVIDYVAHSGNGVALGFHGLGLRTKFIDYLGDDPQGAQVLARYAAVGLDFDYLPAPYGTPRSVNLVDSQGRRFSFYDGRHPDDLVYPREFYLPYVQRARHVHVANGRAISVFADARECGHTTSTDVHAWDGVSEWGEEMAREADIVFLSSAAAPNTIDDVMRSIMGFGRAQVVVATECADGSRVLTRGTSEVRRFPAARRAAGECARNRASEHALLDRRIGQPATHERSAERVTRAVAVDHRPLGRGPHEEIMSAAELVAAVERASASVQWKAGRQ